MPKTTQTTTVATRVVPVESHIQKEITSQFELEKLIMDILLDLTGQYVDPDRPLISQGLDSLAAMELSQKVNVSCSIINVQCALYI